MTVTTEDSLIPEAVTANPPGRASRPRITVEQMREKLKTVDQTVTMLSATEPLSEITLDTGAHVSFRMMPDWNLNIDGKRDDDPVDVFFKIGTGDSVPEYQLTKDGVFQATSAAGIQKAYVAKTPARLMEPHVNYWYQGGMGHKQFKMLARDNQVLAWTKGTVIPFSNLQLLEQALNGIEAVYGRDARNAVLIDHKTRHSLRRTHMRLIVPEVQRQIVSARHARGEEDNWSVGVSIQNSQIGEEATVVDGYLFAWWCTNGAIDTFASSGQWSRRSGDQGDVYEWARHAVDDVLGGLERSLDNVQALTNIAIEGDVNQVMGNVFERYGVPSPARRAIVEQMVESDDLTMYGLMNAITAAANDFDLSDAIVNNLLRIGGEIPRVYGQGRVAFEALDQGNLDLSGELMITTPDGREIATRVRKLPSDN